MTSPIATAATPAPRQSASSVPAVPTPRWDTYPTRIVAFDCGTSNMGMCCIGFVGEEPAMLLALDWRPLAAAATTNTVGLVDAVGMYLDTIPLDSDAPPMPTSRASPPTIVLVEQQYIDVTAGSNIKAKEVEVALVALCRARFPRCHIASIGASARNSEGTKLRARAVGESVVTQHAAPDLSDYYYSIARIEDRQHINDAMTMVADYAEFANMPGLREQFGKKRAARTPRAPGTATRAPRARRGARTTP